MRPLDRRLSRGQSLVEMAIITPLLIFFLMGILEVGIALRNYVVLANANREAARFAVRPRYLNMAGNSYEEIGYQAVLDHTYQATAGQLTMNYAENSEMIINVVQIDTGFPCDPALKEQPVGNDYWPNCDCDLVATSPYTPYLITNYLNNPLFMWQTPVSSETRIDIEALSLKLAAENDVHNCKALKKSDRILTSQLDIVVVESIYRHKQFFGFPLISNPLTDPIEMYAQTTMRISPLRDSPFSEGY